MPIKLDLTGKIRQEMPKLEDPTGLGHEQEAWVSGLKHLYSAQKQIFRQLGGLY